MPKNKRYLINALKTVFTDSLFLFLGVSLSLNFLVLFYLIFLQTTTPEVFFSSNTSFYNWTAIGLTLIVGILSGIALAMVVFVLKQRMSGASSATGNSLLGAAFGAISSGCPVCGAWLLPMLGIAGSLAAFPLQGLEIKLLSILLLAFSINESAKSITGLCKVSSEKLFEWKDRHLVLSLNKAALPQLKPAILAVVLLIILYALPSLPQKYKINFAKRGNRATAAASTKDQSNQKADMQSLFSKINPPEGYTVNVKYGTLGPQIIKSGAIDLEKFKNIYERSNTPLTPEQLTILEKGSDKKITIKQDNAYFLINFFWALGLANKNPILDKGPITKYGKIGSFASTGGWTLGSKKTMAFYAKSRILKLNANQQAKVDEVAGNAYRPCCGNPTSFPDCNHGMALLAVLELMASHNAPTGKMYEAAKYFNAFWFPQQYLDIATYFKAKEGKDFNDIDSKLVVSQEFSSGQGWSKTKQWLKNNKLVKQAPNGGGGGCGV